MKTSFKIVWFYVLSIFSTCYSSHSLATTKGFLWGYNLGVSYDTTTRFAQISYNAPHSQSLPENCEISPETPAQMNCTAYLAPDGGSFSPSFYIEEPFIKRGFFYFETGISAATLSYQGVLKPKPKPLISVGAEGKKTTNTASYNEQPLQKATIDLYGINILPSLKFGITPPYFPDLLLGVGLGIQIVGGNVAIFTTKKQTAIIQPGGFVEAEAVLFRFFGSYGSFYIGQDQTLGRGLSSKLIDDNPSNSNLTNFKLTLVGASSGFRLLILW